MKKNTFWSVALAVLFLSLNSLAHQGSPVEKKSVNDRMAKARAAKAEKKASITPVVQAKIPGNTKKATGYDYHAPMNKTQKGPHGEVVQTGERGGKFYINKNGNKTYISSNQ